MKGYIEYCQANSKLFYTIIDELKDNNSFVLVASSGFLVHEELETLTKKHWRTLKEEGVAILLLPSKSLKESTKIVVKRQMSRGFGLNEKREKEKFVERFKKYQKFGHIKIFSHREPEEIVVEIQRKLSQETSKREL